MWLGPLDTSAVKRPHELLGLGYLRQTNVRATITAYLREVSLVELKR
jgi:hypothetical protein